MRIIKSVLALVSVLAIGLVAGLACSGTSEEAPTPDASSSGLGGISVTGTASISLTPDIATIVLGVESMDETVADARAAAASAMTRIVDVLSDSGVAAEDIQTQRLSIQPQYDYSSEKRELINFVVTNIVNVTVRDIDSVGPIIDKSVEAGGDLTRIQSIYFSVDDTDPYQDQLIAEAVQDATDKATQLAELTGVSLGKPLAINSGGGAPYPVFDGSFAMAMAEDSARFSTSISPGEVETSVTVNIIFAIE